MLAWSGLGQAAIRLAQGVGGGASAAMRRVEMAPVDEFGEWCDPLWEQCRDEYVMSAVRDRAALRILYPSNGRFVRLKVSRAGRVIGWTVVLVKQMSANKYFGDLRVGTIVDCLARAQDADSTIRAATVFLERTGVDLIVSNQSARWWCRALRRNGYLRGPSNFIFAPSKQLRRLLEPLDDTFHRTHLTRGDGEGPSTL